MEVHEFKDGKRTVRPLTLAEQIIVDQYRQSERAKVREYYLVNQALSESEAKDLYTKERT